jgi:hypothetical protein
MKKKNNLKPDSVAILEYNDNKFLALALISIVSLSSLGGIAIYWNSQPTISTIYYHFNIQYRAGYEESYDHICEAVEHLIDMYDNHTSWNWSLECQFMLIEWAKENYSVTEESGEPLEEQMFYKLQKQNQRGQLELIVPQYSDQWHVAHTLKDLKQSVNYTTTRLNEWNLTRSSVIVFQEGQWLPGFTQLGDTGEFEAAVMHLEQATYFDYYPKDPVLKWNFGGIEKYAFVNPRLPVFEGMAYHHQIYAADGELLNTGDVKIHGGPASEFEYNEEKQKNHEEKLIALEKRGNQFMTMESFLHRCIEKNQVGILNKFIPECEWVAAQYDQYFTWMGNGNGATDDGYLLSRIYYAGKLTQATEQLLNHAYSTGRITEENYTEWGNYRINGVDGLLLEANKEVWKAQVSDTTGITPRYEEWWYGLNNTKWAIDKCKTIISNIKAQALTEGNPYPSIFQINPYTDEIVLNGADFINDTYVETKTLEQIENLFDLDIEVSQKTEFDLMDLNPITKFEKRYYNASNWSIEYYRMQWDFYGKYNITMKHDEANYLNESTELPNYITNNGTTDVSDSNEISVKFIDDFKDVIYSPALAENLTQNLTRSDYFYRPYGSSEEWYLLLSLCNGLLYNPEKKYAIVKNVTANHLAALWREENVEFLETKVKYNSTRDYFLVSGELSDILRFANQINAYKVFTID